MIKLNKHIEIVRSSTIRLSSMSQASCDAIFNVLFDHYTDVGVTVVNNLSDLENLAASRPDLVFLGMKYVPGDEVLGPAGAKIWVADYLDKHGIAYTGSGRAAHELELNKHLAKQQVADAGLETSPFYVIERSQQQTTPSKPLSFPLFVKPTDRGGGVGINSSSLVYNSDELHSKVRAIASKLGSDSLIESYLPGREFSVSILKDEDSANFLIMPIELIARPNELGVRLLSEEVKSSNTEQAIGVADENMKNKVMDLAINVFYALGARDYGRIDIRLDGADEPQFLEANLLPSLISGYGSFPKACVLNINLGYESMILSIVGLAMARSLGPVEKDTEPALTPVLLPLETALGTI